jgi:hypothetical protein
MHNQQEISVGIKIDIDNGLQLFAALSFPTNGWRAEGIA